MWIGHIEYLTYLGVIEDLTARPGKKQEKNARVKKVRW